MEFHDEHCDRAGQRRYVTKNIEDIQIGDIVLAKDQHNPDGPLMECRVVNTFVRYDKEVSTVTLTEPNSSATLEITGTSEHPFYVVGKGFVNLGDLDLGDICVAPDGTQFVVTDIVLQEERQTVYNFEVEFAHTYYVGTGLGMAVLVHNQCTNVPPKEHGDIAIDDFRNRNKEVVNGLRKVGENLDTAAEVAAAFNGPVIALETITGARATSTTGERVPLWERALNFLAGGLGAVGIGKAGQAATKIEAHTVQVAGQLHHPITAKIIKQLSGNKNISKEFLDKYKKFTTQAADHAAHNGYQHWHREIDAEMVKWLEHRPKATEKQIINKLKKLYAQEDVAWRFPNFLTDLENWLQSLTPVATNVPPTIKP